jgi:hypothetical protein
VEFRQMMCYLKLNRLSLARTQEQVLDATEDQHLLLVTELLSSNGIENVQLVDSGTFAINTREDACL